MATYAIGDIQGCYHTLQALLQRLAFDAEQDQLWLVGDIINRGSGSLAMLRWCYQHKDSVKMVLGNHDLHAIAVAHGAQSAHRSDTLQALFAAEDSQPLLNWLRMQPLIWAEHGYVMVHAGLHPHWTLNEALSLAGEVAAVLRGDDYIAYLQHMYGNTPTLWQPALEGYARLRMITNVCTRMRVCSASGELDYTFKGELKDLPDGLMPWFAVPERSSQGMTIICGHWSALGLYQQNNVYALDTGCLWGRQLTALCLETKQITQVNLDPRDQPR
ncbi:MAG TPA: symmetrical bis(5'-nucleosyl)-tetraphosphatase [Methylophilus sp.]